MEPSAMLVAAFRVEVGGPGKSGLLAEHGGMARARLEPHVDDVHFLLERRCAAVRTLRSFGNDGRSLFCVPGIGAFPREQFHHGPIGLWRFERFAAAFAKEHRDWGPPNALARDAPIRTRSDHV